MHDDIPNTTRSEAPAEEQTHGETTAAEWLSGLAKKAIDVVAWPFKAAWHGGGEVGPALEDGLGVERGSLGMEALINDIRDAAKWLIRAVSGASPPEDEQTLPSAEPEIKRDLHLARTVDLTELRSAVDEFHRTGDAEAFEASLREERSTLAGRDDDSAWVQNVQIAREKRKEPGTKGGKIR